VREEFYLIPSWIFLVVWSYPIHIHNDGSYLSLRVFTQGGCACAIGAQASSATIISATTWSYSILSRDFWCHTCFFVIDMGRLVIAHHKSYHPYRRDNIERVRRDEEEARLKEEREEGRMLLAVSIISSSSLLGFIYVYIGL
jgi:hypothetical protein